MDEATQQMLNATGFAPEQQERYLALERQGRLEECVRM